MKTIYLHIGQTKTATTTLQAFFYSNKKWLGEHGIYYPECPATHPIQSQHRFLVESLRKIPLPIPDNLEEWTYILDKISAAPHDKILISEEVFWHLFEQRQSGKIQAIQWIKQKLEGYEVKVICYLRRQDKWIESWYNQIVKTDVNANSRLKYCEFINKYKSYGLLNYQEALAPWAEVFGKDNVKVRPFERKAFLDGDIIADFMSILGVALDETAVRPKDHQVSLCNSACELSAIYNNTQRAAEFKHKFMVLVRDYDVEVNDRRKFTKRELAESLVNEFYDANASLSNEYGKDGETFFDSEFPGYEYGEYQGLSTQESAAFMFHIFQDLQGQIRGLRRRISELESNSSGDK